MKNIKNKNNGFTFIELLIALVIGAMLMTAIAVAFDASVKNYTANESLFKATNMARQALTRITNQLRTASSVTNDYLSSECTILSAEGQNITYQYRPDSDKLYLIDNGSGSEYLLCENIPSMIFEKNIESNIVKSVIITIDVTVLGESKKLAAAAVVRRNLN